MLLKSVFWRVRTTARRIKWSLLFLRRRLGPPPIPKNPDGKILLHIGCGEIDSPGFINFDARPFPHVHYVTEALTDLSMFSDQTIDLVYMCHILEHVAMREVLPVLWEMRRVLKKGGILRVSVPDFDRLCQVYYRKQGNVRSVHLNVMGEQDYPQNFHRSIFDRKYLSALAYEVGFTEVREWDPTACEYHDFQDAATASIRDSDGTRHPISLNLELVN
jgi:predicted SAM-dependent methyltransferase